MGVPLLIVAPKVRVVLLNYDGGDVTTRCLDALMEIDYPREDLEIVMVDNASIDGLVWRVPRDYAAVRVIENLTNEGFARGNNQAMGDLDGIDAVALINNDCIPDPTWLRHLVERMFADASTGATCSKMLFNKEVWGLEFADLSGPVCISNIQVNGRDSLPFVQFDERFDRSGIGAGSPTPQHWLTKNASFWLDGEMVEAGEVTISVELHGNSESRIIVKSQESESSVPVTKNPKWHHFTVSKKSRVINNAGGGVFPGLFGGDLGFRELDLGQRDHEANVFAFCGGAVLLRREFLEDVGLFDDSFFLYYEDFDLSWRGKRRGWEFRYVPKSVVLHEHAFSSGAGSHFFRFWVDRNRRLTLVKNAPLRPALKTIVAAILWALRDCLGMFRHARKSKLPAPRSAIRHRLRQLASFVKALPGAIAFRYSSSQGAVVRRRFVYQWITQR
jgi:GT2 family glycosyltransferase